MTELVMFIVLTNQPGTLFWYCICLGEIGAGVSRLKELSLGMNDELSRQNDQLDRLMVKTSANDSVLQSQNKQMRGLLS